MDSSSVLGFSAGGSAIAVITYFLLQMCVKHKIHTKFISACCRTEIDIDTNSPKIANLEEKLQKLEENK